jgi:predicted ArsR family transcriptional regulator
LRDLPRPSTDAARHIVTLLDFAGPLELPAIDKEVGVGYDATRRLLEELENGDYLKYSTTNGQGGSWHTTNRWSPEDDEPHDELPA